MITGSWTLQVRDGRCVYMPDDEHAAKYDILNDPTAHDRLLTDPPVPHNPVIRVTTEDGRLIFEETQT